MQLKFHKDDTTVIERLNAKISYQEREIQRLNQQLARNQPQNTSRLLELMASEPKISRVPQEQMSFGQNHDGMIDMAHYRLLLMQVRTLNWALESAEEKRAQSEAEVLINRQILIEQQHFSRLLAQSYEQKIKELRKSLLSKEMQLDSRRQNQSTVDKKDKKVEFSRADQEMVFKKMIDALQKQFLDEKRERIKIRRQHQRLRMLNEHTVSYNRRLCKQLIDCGILPVQPPCQLIEFEQEEVQIFMRTNGNNHQKIIVPQPTIQMGACCAGLRQILYKKSIIERQLLQQVHRLSKMIGDMKSAYDIMVKANIQKDDIIKRKRCQSEMTAEKTEFTRSYQKYCILKMAQELNQRMKRNRIRQPIYKFRSKSVGQPAPADKIRMGKLKKAVLPFLGQFSAISRVDCTLSRYLVSNFQEV